MTVLDPVVGPASDLLPVGIAELGHRGLVGAQAIGGDWTQHDVSEKLHPQHFWIIADVMAQSDDR